MERWEDFAAFGDITELEHVCYLLEEEAKVAAQLSPADCMTGEGSHLSKRLVRQADESRAVIERERPGLYDRTWIADLFGRLSVRLEEVTERPACLPNKLSGIFLDLHKVMIAAHDVFDPARLKVLVEKAREDGASELRQKISENGRVAVSKRADQQDKSVFCRWLKEMLAAGATPRNIEAVKELQGFKPGWATQYKDEALKGWARECGCQFRSGRTPKKTTGQGY